MPQHAQSKIDSDLFKYWFESSVIPVKPGIKLVEKCPGGLSVLIIGVIWGNEM